MLYHFNIIHKILLAFVPSFFIIEIVEIHVNAY
jgi:hypothetical protein